jgi:hypothetical protein
MFRGMILSEHLLRSTTATMTNILFKFTIADMFPTEKNKVSTESSELCRVIGN